MPTTFSSTKYFNFLVNHHWNIIAIFYVRNSYAEYDNVKHIKFIEVESPRQSIILLEIPDSIKIQYNVNNPPGVNIKSIEIKEHFSKDESGIPDEYKVTLEKYESLLSVPIKKDNNINPPFPTTKNVVINNISILTYRILCTLNFVTKKMLLYSIVRDVPFEPNSNPLFSKSKKNELKDQEDEEQDVERSDDQELDENEIEDEDEEDDMDDMDDIINNIDPELREDSEFEKKFIFNKLTSLENLRIITPEPYEGFKSQLNFIDERPLEDDEIEFISDPILNIKQLTTSTKYKNHVFPDDLDIIFGNILLVFGGTKEFPGYVKVDDDATRFETFICETYTKIMNYDVELKKLKKISLKEKTQKLLLKIDEIYDNYQTNNTLLNDLRRKSINNLDVVIPGMESKLTKKPKKFKKSEESIKKLKDKTLSELKESNRNYYQNKDDFENFIWRAENVIDNLLV